jgi:two-component system chemotaxis sensor kinase CheA
MNVDTLLQQFLSEAAELLDRVDAGLLQLEREPKDRPVLDEIFRAAHTLKGSSGLFDLPALTRLNHAAEDLLDGVRSGQLELTVDMIDDLLAAFDLVRAWLDVIERTQTLPTTAAREGAALGARLRGWLEPAGESSDRARSERVPVPRSGDGSGVGRHGAAVSGAERGAATAPPAPDWLPAALGVERVKLVRDWLEHAQTRCRVLRYTPTEQCFFTGDDPLHLVAQTPAIEALAISPSRPWPTLAEFDEYQSQLVFTVVTRATVSELDHLYRYVPDEVVTAEVDAEGLSRLLDGEVVRPGPIPAAARELLAAQLTALRGELPTDQAQARIASVGTVARSVLLALGCPDGRLADLSAAVALALRDVAPAPLISLLERELDRVVDEVVPGQGPSPVEATAAEPAAATTSPDDAVDRADAAPGTAGVTRPDQRTGPADRRTASARVLKVDQATVDRLMDLVGQLVVAKNGLPFLAEAADHDWNARPLARRIKDQYGVVHRISEDLQAAVMDVRMLPMSVVFARFPRMVRDLARSLGKEVELVLAGEDTAADKDIIEILGDPLVHLIRNSLDHGIEAPDVRVAAGKPAQATVLLRAAQEPDAVVIDIIDDGRGIDPEVIKRKAYQRGLITEEQLARITDQEAVNLVFLPGFSTAERISDVSGRGVGMDAVRASVEAVGGSVRMSSTPGTGSQVRLRVPLSMAVSRVMIVTAGSQRFGVPVDLVVETVRVPTERVARVERQPVIVLRDTLVPLVDLAGTLQLPDRTADQADVSVLVTRPNGADVGLVVDAFHEGAEVIVKPMEGVLAGSRQFCGTALMGDGSVLLVLDLKEVLAGAGDPVP